MLVTPQDHAVDIVRGLCARVAALPAVPDGAQDYHGLIVDIGLILADAFGEADANGLLPRSTLPTED